MRSIYDVVAHIVAKRGTPNPIVVSHVCDLKKKHNTRMVFDPSYIHSWMRSVASPMKIENGARLRW
jgi:hypothetical protein